MVPAPHRPETEVSLPPKHLSDSGTQDQKPAPAEGGGNIHHQATEEEVLAANDPVERH